MKKEVEKCDIEEFCKNLISDHICDEIKRKTLKIHPLKQVYIYKVKVLKKPKMDCIPLLLKMFTFLVKKRADRVVKKADSSGDDDE